MCVLVMKLTLLRLPLEFVPTVLLDVSIVLKEVPEMVGLGFHQHLGENTMLTDTFAPFINQRKM